jgi:hypothetical protein
MFVRILIHLLMCIVCGACPLLKAVRNYVSNIFTKLQVADRAQAIVRAREAGLGWDGERS